MVGVVDRVTPGTTRTERLLAAATGVFAVAVVIHNADHVRRGADAVPRGVFGLGTSGIVLEVLLVVLVCARHRIAPLATAVAGAVLAAGYLLVHFVPADTPFSDALARGDVDGLTWFAASFEVVAAVSLALAGLAVLRARGGVGSAARPRADERTLAAGLREPLALAFAVSQVVTLAVSLAQL